MSHSVKLAIKVKSISALEVACKTLGLNLVEKGTCRGYYGATQRDYVVQLKGRYDVGLTLTEDGTYCLDADFWGGDVEREVGEKCGTLLQTYGKAVVEEAAHRADMSVFSEYLQNGDIKLTLQQYA